MYFLYLTTDLPVGVLAVLMGIGGGSLAGGSCLASFWEGPPGLALPKNFPPTVYAESSQSSSSQSACWEASTALRK